MVFRSIRSFLAVVIITAALLIGMTTLPETNWQIQQQGEWFPLGIPKVVAQRMREEDVWQQIYDRFPTLPRENQYINRQTGQTSPSNTLVTRLIRYHVYVKQRPANYRLDWKLTLADYLEANERINEATYPGADTLQTNPLEGDRTILQSLDRSQREALVQALVEIFSPPTATPAPSPNASTTPAPSAEPTAPTQPREPRPGDAQLLLQ